MRNQALSHMCYSPMNAVADTKEFSKRVIHTTGRTRIHTPLVLIHINVVIVSIYSLIIQVHLIGPYLCKASRRRYVYVIPASDASSYIAKCSSKHKNCYGVPTWRCNSTLQLVWAKFIDTAYSGWRIGQGGPIIFSGFLSWPFQSRLSPLGPCEECCLGKPRRFRRGPDCRIAVIAGDIWDMSGYLLMLANPSTGVMPAYLVLGTLSSRCCDFAWPSFVYHFLRVILHSYCTLRVYIKSFRLFFAVKLFMSVMKNLRI